METNASKPRVLIVDDNLELAATFKELLDAHGFDPMVASNGVLALKLILHDTVDAVICDLKMPQLEGDMFFTAVQRLNPALARRFIFITGMADDPHFQKFVANVKAPLLRKPVPLEKLLEALNGVLQKHP